MASYIIAISHPIDGKIKVCFLNKNDLTKNLAKKGGILLGAILSDPSHHIWIDEKSEFFAKNSEKGRFCFGHISMKSDSPMKVLGSRTIL